MKIIYSETTISTLKEIAEFLKIRWTQKELKQLKTCIELFEQTVSDKLIVHQSTEFDK